jgi:hypothetical protein
MRVDIPDNIVEDCYCADYNRKTRCEIRSLGQLPTKLFWTNQCPKTHKVAPFKLAFSKGHVRCSRVCYQYSPLCLNKIMAEKCYFNQQVAYTVDSTILCKAYS